ncbi:MAG: superoxide dismutase, Ni [Chloroflexota bacterium]
MSRFTSWFAPRTVARAHCDVPCGIYDPAGALLGAKTVARMVEIIGGLPVEDGTVAERNKFTRCVLVKEQHAELVKRDIAVIWSDYFKPEHVEKHPQIHELTWSILKLAGKNKQSVDAEAAAQLIAKVEEFAAIFWETKK